jgi:hypothetical protein
MNNTKSEGAFMRFDLGVTDDCNRFLDRLEKEGKQGSDRMRTRWEDAERLRAG